MASGPQRELKPARPGASPASGRAAVAQRVAAQPGLRAQPGHLIRRAHQMAVARFAEAVGRDITPLQYAVLLCLHERPGIDQVTLAAEVALDNSTTADLAVRLESKGWITRELLPRRQRALRLTDEGLAQLARLTPAIAQLQQRQLAGLSAAEAQQLMVLLERFVLGAEASGADAPTGPDDPPPDQP